MVVDVVDRYGRLSSKRAFCFVYCIAQIQGAIKAMKESTVMAMPAGLLLFLYSNIA